MKLIQYTGPFSEGQAIEISGSKYDSSWVHIGIQIPKRQPVATWKEDELPLTWDVEVNGLIYKINETGILEFDDTAEIGWRIVFLQKTPPEASIELVYTEDGK